MIFTCQSIADSAVFVSQVGNETVAFNKKKLSTLVTNWKVLVQHKYNAKPGNTVAIAFSNVDIYYYSAVVAAIELGLSIVVLPLSDGPDGTVLYNPNKIESFLPLDLAIVGFHTYEPKGNWVINNSKQVVHATELLGYKNARSLDEYQQYVNTVAEPTSTTLMCTSSGTTGTPKPIVHTAEFIHNVSKRNAEQLGFAGRVMHTRLINHGSSIVSFFLPTMMCNRVTHHYSYVKPIIDPTELIQLCVELDINHLQIDFSGAMEHFLKSAAAANVVFKDLTIHCIGVISYESAAAANKCNAKLVSIFGSNETNGPILVNRYTPGQTNFVYNEYTTLDDYFRLSYNNEAKQLHVYINEYQTTVTLQDEFTVNGNQFVHYGRSDLIRINDIELDLKFLLALCDDADVNGHLVIDRQFERIYYAQYTPCTEQELQQNIQMLNRKIADKYSTAVSIARASIVGPRSSFIIGTKPDLDYLRTHFRNLP